MHLINSPLSLMLNRQKSLEYDLYKKSQKEPVVPKIGDIVLIEEEKIPRKQWRMAKILDIEIKRGSVRQCTVQVLSPKGNLITKLKRSPHQLVPLEVDSREEKKLASQSKYNNVLIGLHKVIFNW